MKLKNKNIAILIEHHFQDLEVWYPYYRLIEEGARVQFAGPEKSKTYSGKFGYPATSDIAVKQLKFQKLDAVIIPGGWAPDFLRRHSAVINLVRKMNESRKTIAAICHAGWVLASADIVQGRVLTSFSAIKDDMIHAGAEYVDREVVVDRNLITSRNPDDLPAFLREIIKVMVKS